MGRLDVPASEMSKLGIFLAQLEGKKIKQNGRIYGCNGNGGGPIHWQKQLRKAVRATLPAPVAHESMPAWRRLHHAPRHEQ